MTIRGPFNSGLAVGGDASATANTSSTQRLHGLVNAVYVEYKESPPAGTCDVVLKGNVGERGEPETPILTLTNGATDGVHYPRAAECGTDGVATGGKSAMIHLNCTVNVKIDQVNAGDNVNVWIDMIETEG